VLGAVTLALGVAGAGHAGAPEEAPPHPLETAAGPAPVPLAESAPAPCDRPLPINLPVALQLAGVRPIDVALASESIRLEAARLERARVLWLPTVYLGADYFRHDGQIQDVAGNVFSTSKGQVQLGAGPYAVFALSDALFAPLAARQVVAAREADLQAARNDSLQAVAEAYFNVQQARGELAGAEDAARRAEDVVRRAQGLAPGGLVPPVEVTRARTELARRRQAVASARERWRTASADLNRVLRLDPAALTVPLEPPHLRVTLVPADRSVDDLIAVGLTNRPELAAQQALVQATLERLRQEKLRPLIPSVLLRGGSTPVTGTLAGGYFGGGLNDTLKDFGARSDFDVQVLWEFQNLGLGNRARVNERKAENRLAMLELFRIQDRVAAEVAQAHAQLQSAAARLTQAEAGVKDASLVATQNAAALGQTTGDPKLLILVVRPQEVVAAIQALAQAYADYYGAVADYDRSQFRLYRALGQPAQLLTGAGPADPAAASGCSAAELAPPVPLLAPVPPTRSP
jgi:outer membrane protein TolC